MLNKDLFLSAFLVFLGVSSHSQEPTFIHYTSDDGLLSNEVYGLLEDRKGFIWMATDKGVCRFDSYQMQGFTLKSGLADAVILSMHQDSEDRIWFLSYNGRLSYWQADTVHNAHTDERLEEIISESFFNSFLEDGAGNLWFGTNYDGVFRIDGTIVKRISSPDAYFKPKRLDSTYTRFAQRFLFESEEGKVQYTDGLNQYELDGTVFKKVFESKKRKGKGRLHYDKQKDLLVSSSGNRVVLEEVRSMKLLWEKTIPAANVINKAAILPDDLLYVASDNGLYVLGADGSVERHVLKGKGVSDMLIDREGNLWVSTLAEGVFLIPDQHAATYVTKPRYSLLKVNDTIYAGGGAYELDFIAKNRLHRSPISYSPDNLISKQDQINVLAYDHRQNIWMGTQKGLYRFKNRKTFLNHYDKVYDLAFFKNDLFIGGYKETIKWDQRAIQNIEALYQHARNAADINAILKSNRDSLVVHDWTSLCFSNVVRGQLYMATKDEILHAEGPDHKPHSVLPLKDVIAIQQTGEHDLWILRKDSGLYFYRHDVNKLKHIKLPQAPKETMYSSLDLDDAGNPWMGSNKGAFYLEKTKAGYSVRHVDQRSGLFINEVNDIIATREGAWLATSKGVSYLPRTSLDDTIPPLFYVDSIHAGQLSSRSSVPISLSDDANSLTIYYTGISYKDRGKLSFEYHLEGKHPLSGTTDERKLLLTDLPPSDYSLSMAAIDAHGNKSRLREIKFSVALSWWKDWRYWLTGFILALIVASFIARLVFRKSFGEMYALLSGKIPFLDRPKHITAKSVSTGGLEKIALNKLLYIEAAGDYMELFTTEKKLLVRTTLKSLAEALADETEFVRVHKSYIVNLKQVDVFHTDHLEIAGKQIPIARNKKREVKAYAASL